MSEVKGNKCNWKDRLDIGRAEVEHIMLTPAAYFDTYDLAGGEHQLNFTMNKLNVRLGPKKFRGWPFQGKPGSQLVEILDNAESTGDSRFSLRPAQYFDVVHIALYHKEAVIKNGKALMYKHGDKAGQPIVEMQRVTDLASRRKLSRDPDEDTRIAVKKFLEMGIGHHRAFIKGVFDACDAMCTCGGELEVEHYVCNSCGAVLLDPMQGGVSPEDMANFGNSECACGQCDAIDYPTAVHLCSLNCDTPKQESMFNVVIGIKKEGLGLDTKMVVKTVTSASKFKIPGGSVAALVEGGEFIFDEEDNFILQPEIMECMSTQFDFLGSMVDPQPSQVIDFLGIIKGEAGWVDGASQGYQNPAQKKRNSRLRVKR